MKLFAFIRRLFSKRKTRPNIFFDALSEGLKDMFREMGYPGKDEDSK